MIGIKEFSQLWGSQYIDELQKHSSLIMIIGVLILLIYVSLHIFITYDEWKIARHEKEDVPRNNEKQELGNVVSL